MKLKENPGEGTFSRKFAGQEVGRIQTSIRGSGFESFQARARELPAQRVFLDIHIYIRSIHRSPCASIPPPLRSEGSLCERRSRRPQTPATGCGVTHRPIANLVAHEGITTSIRPKLK
jgi:hypothetical protein